MRDYPVSLGADAVDSSTTSVWTGQDILTTILQNQSKLQDLSGLLPDCTIYFPDGEADVSAQHGDTAGDAGRKDTNACRPPDDDVVSRLADSRKNLQEVLSNSKTNAKTMLMRMDEFERKAQNNGIKPPDIAMTYGALSRLIGHDGIDKNIREELASVLLERLANPSVIEQGEKPGDVEAALAIQAPHVHSAIFVDAAISQASESAKMGKTPSTKEILDRIKMQYQPK